MNKKSTKKALLLSALAMFACVAMLIGSTFAWFTDSVTSAGNKIEAGTLKIDLELLDKDGNWSSIKESKAALFNYDLWEPGYTEVKVLKIENEGTLALQWVAQFQSEKALSALANVIDVYVLKSATEIGYPADRNLAGYTKVGTVAEFVNNFAETENGTLLAGEEAYLAIALKMQESAGNEYQGLSLGEFDIKIFATQYTYEKDSFDDQYDKGATVATVADMKAALAEGATSFNFMGNEINLSYGLSKAMVPAGKTVTISNAVVSGKSYGNAADGTVIFENCTFTNTGAYSIHFDAGNGDVIFKNCELYGWNSFGGSLNSVSFYDCALYGNGTYGLIRSYADLYVENCYIDTTNANHSDNYSEGIEAVSGATLTEVNNTYVATTLSEVMALAKKGNTTIDAKGANLGDFNYDGTFANGTVLKNAKFTYVYGASIDGVATFENCEFVSDHSYSANFSDGSYTGKAIFNNCLFDGWSSFGDAITGVEMNGCTFEWNNPYSMLRFYQNAVLTDCDFVAIEGVDTNKTGTVVEFVNCTGIEGKIYNNSSNVGTWIVDGVDISSTITSW